MAESRLCFVNMAGNVRLEVYIFNIQTAYFFKAHFGHWDNGRTFHGFARVKTWSVKENVTKVKQITNIIQLNVEMIIIKKNNIKANESVSLVMSLKDDEETRAMWNHSFELTYNITMKRNELSTHLSISNTGKICWKIFLLLIIIV